MFTKNTSDHPPGGVEDVTEVYGSDGTAAGTHLLTTLNSPAYYDWLDVTLVGEFAYFNASQNNTEYIWRSNGTPCGTYTVSPGTRENYGLVALGSDLIFGGFTIKTGNEPHIYRNINALAGTPPCVEETFVAAMSAMESQDQKRAELAYPNPFTNSFTFKMEYESADDIEVGIFTIYGIPVENAKLKSNTEYDLGNAWPKGSYVMKVKTARKTVTHQVVKK